MDLDRARTAVAAAALLLPLAIGCTPSQPPDGTGNGLEVREPRATLTPDAGAVYLTVVNHGSSGDRLLRVETGTGQAAETHESVEEQGVVRMAARPDGFEVPAGGTLELQPGGKHIMLVGARPAGPAPETIRLTLHFEHSGAVEVEAPVSAIGEGGEGEMDHSGHDMGGMDHSGHDMHGTDHSGHAEPAPPAEDPAKNGGGS